MNALTRENFLHKVKINKIDKNNNDKIATRNQHSRRVNSSFQRIPLLHKVQL